MRTKTKTKKARQARKLPIELKHTCPDILVDVEDNETWSEVQHERANCPLCILKSVTALLAYHGNEQWDEVKNARKLIAQAEKGGAQ